MEKEVKYKLFALVVLIFIAFLFGEIFDLGKPTITGYAVINNSVFSSSADFSSGTFSNTFSLGNGDHIRLGFNLTRVSSLVDGGSGTDGYLNGARGVFVSGDYAYVVSVLNNSINIINITNKSNPVNISHLVDSGYLNGARGIYISGDYAYVTGSSNDSLNIINITNKSNPVRISSLVDSSYLQIPIGIYVLGDYAYVTGNFNDSISIINITDKSNPVNISHLVDSSYLDGARRVFVSGDYAYVTAFNNDSINIINITNKSNPVNISHLVDSGYLNGARGIYVLGDYAYVTGHFNNSLNIINITNKSNPVNISHLVDSGYLNGAVGIFVSGDYAYVTGQSNGSINIIDVSNKSNPIRISSLVDSGSGTDGYLNGAINVFVSGDYAYVVSSNNDSINIININQTYPSGTYESAVINSTYSTNAKWYHVSWNETESTGTNLSIAFRSCNDPACSGETYSSFNQNSPVSLSLDFNQYFQFKVNFNTTNTSFTPKLHSINISYSDDLTNPTATFTCFPASVTRGDLVTCTCSGSDAGVGLNNSATSDAVEIITVQTGTFTQSGCSVKDLVGNTGSATGTYLVRSSGGTSSSIQIIQKINSWTEITPAIGAVMTNFDEDIGIKEIQISVVETASNAKIEVRKYSSKPTQVSTEATGTIYKYIEIEATNLEDKLDKAIITIQVEKTWITDNSLEKENIQMLKFDNNSNSWNELSLNFTNEDDTYYFYETELDSFSFFAITGAIVTEETGVIDGIIGTGEKIMDNYGPIAFWSLVGLLIVGIVIVSFAVVYIIRKRRVEDLSENIPK